MFMNSLKKRFFKSCLWALALVLSLSTTAFGSGESPQLNAESIASRKINVVCTTTMITDLVKIIAGNRATVIGLMGPGVDPHLYRASEGDVASISKADMIFFNGLHLEAKLTDILKMMSQKKMVVAVTNAIDRETLLTPPEFEGSYDPHIWFDVQMWISAAQVIRDRFLEIDPKNGQSYRDNTVFYIQELVKLERDIKASIGTIPESKRVLITAHDAFNYFGQAYGIQVKGLQGISTESEAGTKDIRTLAKFIVDNQIPAVFIESSIPKRTIEAVQDAVAALNYDVAIGGELFSDAMGTPGTVEGTYLGMMRHNVHTITSGLTRVAEQQFIVEEEEEEEEEEKGDK